MATRYEKFLGRVECLSGCTRRELRVLARLVDDLSIPAGGHVRVARGEVILVASGDAVVLPDHSMFAVTALRVVLIGRREVLSLLDEAPDLGSCLLAASATSLGEAVPVEVDEREHQRHVWPVEQCAGLEASPPARFVSIHRASS